jgi:hypothetical protein
MFIYIYIYREREREGEKERERERERETVSSSCKHVCASKGRIILSNKSIFSKKSHAPHTSCSQRIVEPSWRPNKRGTFLSVPPHLVIEVCICLISLESDVPVRSQVCCASSTNARPILGCRSAACDTCLHVCVSQCRSKQVACAYALAGGGGEWKGVAFILAFCINLRMCFTHKADCRAGCWAEGGLKMVLKHGRSPRWL